jgi:hypothetical protein
MYDNGMWNFTAGSANWLFFGLTAGCCEVVKAVEWKCKVGERLMEFTMPTEGKQ